GTNSTLGGGAVYVATGNVEFVRTSFMRNVAGATVTDNVIVSGGAVSVNGAGTVVSFANCAFIGNAVRLEQKSIFTTLGYGGAVDLRAGSASFANCRLVGNGVEAIGPISSSRREARGGGIAGTGTLVLSNTTLSENWLTAQTARQGSGLYVVTGGSAQAHNSVFWQNQGAAQIQTASGATATVSHAIVEGGYASGTAVLDADPVFNRPPAAGPDNEWGTADDDYGNLRLEPGSPAIDFGDAALLPADSLDLDGDGNTAEPLPLDLDGEPRVQGPSVELGPYEGAGTTPNEPGADLPAAFALHAPVPNPTSAIASLRFDLPAPVSVRAEVFDVLGRRVAVLHDGALAAGTHPLTLDARALPSGVYLVRVQAGEAVAVRAVTVRR
ncbi:MAG TPA: T9SS type A sorting domain-containing protein, partial [Rubricoccaceae bacterium]|nr:T9SS type A sorting domain-containing protein [Rubricoccaceae bacterium]